MELTGLDHVLCMNDKEGISPPIVELHPYRKTSLAPHICMRDRSFTDFIACMHNLLGCIITFFNHHSHNTTPAGGKAIVTLTNFADRTVLSRAGVFLQRMEQTI